MLFHQTQDQMPFYEMSPRERLAFLIYQADFEPSEFGLALTAMGFSAQTLWAGAMAHDWLWALPMLISSTLQMLAWWTMRHQRGRWARAALALMMAVFWLFLVLRFWGGPATWLYLLPAYTSFWALYRLLLRIRAAAWVEGQRGR